MRLDTRVEVGNVHYVWANRVAKRKISKIQSLILGGGGGAQKLQLYFISECKYPSHLLARAIVVELCDSVIIGLSEIMSIKYTAICL